MQRLAEVSRILSEWISLLLMQEIDMTYDEIFGIIKTWNLDDLARLQDDLNFEMHKRPLILSPEWKAELQRREEQLERGEVKLIPWSEARDRVREVAGLEPLSD